EREQHLIQEAKRLEQAKREKTVAQTPAAGNVAVLAAPETAKSLAVPEATSRSVLIREIKTELKRVGCYAARIDDNSPVAEVLQSVKKFVRYAKVSIPTDTLTHDVLAAIRDKADRVCPVGCTARQAERDGHCVAKSCPRGFVLAKDGSCQQALGISGVAP